MKSKRMMIDLDNEAMRRVLFRNVDLLVKNINDDNEHRVYSAEDLLNAFCWQVEHGETPHPKILEFLRAAFKAMLEDGVDPEKALGLAKKPGQPKNPPGHDFWLAVCVQLERFGDLTEDDVLEHKYMPVTKEQYDECRREYPREERRSHEEACEVVAKLYGYSADTIKKTFQKMKDEKQCPSIAGTRNAAELRGLLNWGVLALPQS